MSLISEIVKICSADRSLEKYCMQSPVINLTAGAVTGRNTETVPILNGWLSYILKQQ